MPPLPLPDDLAADLDATDPLRRYRAAADARDALDGYLESVQADAARALVAAHDGSYTDAARELGYNSPQALRQWLKRRGTGPAAEDEAPRVQEQPALFFRDAREAQDALEDFAGERREVEDRIEPLVLGALAAGVAPQTVYRLTGIPLSTIARLRPAEITVAAELDVFGPEQVLENTARALTAHAETLLKAAPEGDPGAVGAAHIWSAAARALVKNFAPTALWEPDPPHVIALRTEYYRLLGERRAEILADRPGTDPEELADLVREDTSSGLAAAEEAFLTAQREHTEAQPGADETDLPTHLSADAWLATQISEFNRLAAACENPLRIDPDEPASAPYQHAMARAFRDLAAAYLHLRTTGTVPPLPAAEGDAR